uniref:Uncharacterized protein n=1 Tax=Romanomermis culicivorax TaxID=13658 RepID=A0A915KCG1_ROMCU
MDIKPLPKEFRVIGECCNSSFFDPRPFIFTCKQPFWKAVKPSCIFYLQANAPSNFVLSTFKQPWTIRCIIVAIRPAPPFCSP